MDHRRRGAMLLRRLENDARGGRVGHLGRLAQERVEQVADVELAEPVDLEVAVKTVGGFAVLVYVDAGGQDKLCGAASVSRDEVKCGDYSKTYKIKALFPFPDAGEDLLDLLEVAHVARQPFDLGLLTGFLLDLVDGFLPLVFLAVDHDHAGPMEQKGTGDFVAETERDY